ncbi:MAG TPA: 6-carboxytetrahydropterin synthase QueD [Bryobacteraceae bacterium]|nr:6-carboxytetrahydropterin synthase QueD [Bryobacteraceae bacterium]
MFEVTVEESFAAGHALRNYHGKCENVHGHNYKVQVTLQGPRLDAAGLLVDFVLIKKQMRAVVERLDHQFLNDLAPFDVLNPSAENMAKYFYDELSKGLDAEVPVHIGAVKVWETDTASATYRPTPEEAP